jgi:hypothetical protein
MAWRRVFVSQVTGLSTDFGLELCGSLDSAWKPQGSTAARGIEDAFYVLTMEVSLTLDPKLAHRFPNVSTPAVSFPARKQDLGEAATREK